MNFFFCFIMFFYWFTYGDITAYASLYLLDAGLNNAVIGFLLAGASATTVIIQPILADYADKPRSLSVKRIIQIMLVIMLTDTIWQCLTPGRPAPLTGILYLILIVCAQLLMTYTNVMAMQCRRQGININYAVSRGIGSLSYALMSYVMGFVFKFIDPSLQPWLIAGALVFLNIVMALFPFKKEVVPIEEKTASKAEKTGFFKRYKVFGIALIGWVLVHISHALSHNFLYQIVVHHGGNSANQGIAMAIAAISEMPIMFAFFMIEKRFKHKSLFCLPTIFFTLKAVGMLTTSMPLFYAVHALQMMGWGLYCVASVTYVNDIMSDEDCVKGQAYMGMTYTFASVISSLIGGVLINTFGVPLMLYLGIVCSTLGTIVIYTAFHFEKQLSSNN